MGPTSAGTVDERAPIERSLRDKASRYGKPDKPYVVAALCLRAFVTDQSIQELHRLIADLLGHGQEVLGRWASVMVSSRTYAEIVDRHVELYSRLSRPRLSRVSPATQAVGPLEDEWLRENLIAIALLAESLDRGSFELALRIVPLDWWATRLPDQPSTAENLRT